MLEIDPEKKIPRVLHPIYQHVFMAIYILATLLNSAHPPPDLLFLAKKGTPETSPQHEAEMVPPETTTTAEPAATEPPTTESAETAQQQEAMAATEVEVVPQQRESETENREE